MNEAYLEFAKEIALEAGDIMKRYFRSEEIGTTWKEDNTPLTVADTKINKLVIERVKAQFPDHGILGEEESYKADRDLIWIVDPIDGTVPFSLGIPMSTFLLALVDRSDGQAIISVSYDPFLDELLYASKGGGCFISGKKLKTSDKIDFKHAYFAIGIGMTKLIKRLRFEEYSRLMYMQSFGYFYNRVAAGQLLAAVNRGPFAYDIAAPALLVQEAGGIVTDTEGNKVRLDERAEGMIMAANKTVHAKLLKLIKESK